MTPQSNADTADRSEYRTNMPRTSTTTTPTAAPTHGTLRSAPGTQTAPVRVPNPPPPAQVSVSVGALSLRAEPGPVCRLEPNVLVAWLAARGVACTPERIAKIVGEVKAHAEFAADVGLGPDGLLTERGARLVVASLGAGLAGALAEEALSEAFRSALSALRAIVPERPEAPSTAGSAAVSGLAVGLTVPRPANPLLEGPTTTDLGLEERAQIVEALRKTRQNRTEAAKLLEMPRRTFYRKLRDYGILAG